MNSLRYFDFGTARPVLLLIARIAVVLIFIIFGFPKMMGFDGTVQYMASLGAPMPMLAAIIAVVMEVPAAILIVLGFFTRPLAHSCCWQLPGRGRFLSIAVRKDAGCGVNALSGLPLQHRL